MFVTNTQKTHIGIDGVINLGPNEENRYVPDTEDLAARVALLEKNNLVKVNRSEGLTKIGRPSTSVQVKSVEVVSPVKEATIKADQAKSAAKEVAKEVATKESTEVKDTETKTSTSK